jgi:hypothetical protein
MPLLPPLNRGRELILLSLPLRQRHPKLRLRRCLWLGPPAATSTCSTPNRLRCSACTSAEADLRLRQRRKLNPTRKRMLMLMLRQALAMQS